MMGHDQTLEDDQLVEKLEHAVWEERRRLPELLACLGEVDRRKLPITLGYASTFDYCLRHLRFSEDEAYRRISAARACIGRPQLLSAMAEGRLSLTVVSKLAPHIYREDAPDIIARAEGKTSRGVEELLAPLRPETQKRDLMRSIAVTAPAAAESAAAQFVAGSCAIVVPRVEFTFQGSPELRRALERLRELLAHKFPFGGLEDILSEAVQDYIVRHDPQRGLALVKPAPAGGARLPERPGAAPRGA
jgi:hypothetical protein